MASKKGYKEVKIFGATWYQSEYKSEFVTPHEARILRHVAKQKAKAPVKIMPKVVGADGGKS